MGRVRANCPILAKAEQVSDLRYRWQPWRRSWLWYAAPREGHSGLHIAADVSVAVPAVIATLARAIGPDTDLGVNTPWPHSSYRRLRPLQPWTAFPYEDVVGFPSLGTVLALLLVYAHRGPCWTRPTAVLFNGLMIASVPLNGDHDPVEMISDAIVAVIGIATTMLIWEITIL
jgi:hypothetical protein